MSKRYIAFFDVDETLIDIKSMFSFLKYYWKNHADFNKNMAGSRYALYKLKLSIAKLFGESREIINQKYYEIFSQVRVNDLQTLGNDWWQTLSADANIYNHCVIQELKNHQRRGADIVLVSGSMPACIDPLANELGIQHRLLTRLESINGIYTGRILGHCNINLGKRQNILEFIQTYKKPVDLAQCYAYGDHKSDLPMLELVGHPVVVANDPELVLIAKNRNWKIIN